MLGSGNKSMGEEGGEKVGSKSSRSHHHLAKHQVYGGKKVGSRSHDHTTIW